MLRKIAVAALVVSTAWMAISAPDASVAQAADEGIYTLYRSSLVDGSRVHIATLDSAYGADYNSDVCRHAARVLRASPPPSLDGTIYWCEPGRFHKEAIQ